MRRSNWLFRVSAIVVVLFVCLMVPYTGLAAGDTLVIATMGDAVTMDPHGFSETTNEMITNHIFARLVKGLDDMTLGPDLAKSWKMINDTTWEFKLRKGLKFTNGEPFNAAAAKFSLERAAKSPKSQVKVQVPPYKEINVIDEYTLHFVTPAFNPEAMTTLREVAIVPPKYYEKWDKEDYRYLATHPVGLGPYKLVEWVKDDHIEMVKNDDWTLDELDFDRVIFRPIPEDATRLAALISGEIDICQTVPAQDIPRVEKDPNLYILRCPSLRVLFLHMDKYCDKGGPAPKMQPGIEAGKPNPFKDIRVRKAVAHAINIDEIIKYVMEGNAFPATQILVNEVPGSDPNLKRLKYDPELAKKLLKEAGYPRGINFKINFGVPNDRYINDKEIGEVIVDQLAKVGIKLNLIDQPKAVFFPKILRYELPMCMYGWSNLSWTATYNAQLRFPGEGVGRFNVGRVNDPEMERKMDEADRATDLDKRYRLRREVTAYAFNNAYIIPLHNQSTVNGVNKRIKIPCRADERLFGWSAKKVK